MQNPNQSEAEPSSQRPQLILLNGPLGIGKTTIAQRFADENPLTLRLDIDEIRRYISHYRDEPEQSAISAKQMALAMASVHLSLGHHVIVPQIIRDADYFHQFEQLARQVNAKFFEVLLTADRDESIRRFIERGKADGYPDGFRPDGLIDRGGREEKLVKMYDEMMKIVSQRPNTITIHPEFGKENETYQELVQHIGQTALI
jgi:predicted kinase